MSRIVTADEFMDAMRTRLESEGIHAGRVRSVTGPGRSGAIAAATASHMLGVPFFPFDRHCPDHLRPLLIIDTAAKSGRTLRRAERMHGKRSGDAPVVALAIFNEPPRVRFWYEAGGAA